MNTQVKNVKILDFIQQNLTHNEPNAITHILDVYDTENTITNINNLINYVHYNVKVKNENAYVYWSHSSKLAHSNNDDDNIYHQKYYTSSLLSDCMVYLATDSVLKSISDQLGLKKPIKFVISKPLYFKKYRIYINDGVVNHTSLRDN
jgi:hypothetical protein